MAPTSRMLIVIALIAMFAMSAMALFTHEAPSSQQYLEAATNGATPNRFVIQKTDQKADPTYTYWMTSQYNVQVIGSLQQWFINLNEPHNIYELDLNQLSVLSNRLYFYSPSQNVYFVYSLVPNKRVVSGNNVVYFSNFDYYYCGTASSLNAATSHAPHTLGDECQQRVNEPDWSLGYIAEITTWYASTGPSYLINMPATKQYQSNQFMYAGLNTAGEVFLTSAYGRSAVVPYVGVQTNKQVQQTGQVLSTDIDFQGNPYAIANVTTYFYYMNNAQYGWTIPYDYEYFSIRSVGGYVPVCSFWNLVNGAYFPLTLTKYSAADTYFALIPKSVETSGFIATCTVKVVGKYQDDTGRVTGFVPVRVHDMPTASFGFVQYQEDTYGSPAPAWEDYQQFSQEFNWY
eukprot:UN04145